MSDGLWQGSSRGEILRQAGLTRHRLLVVNTGTDLAAGWNDCDASGMASEDPNNIAPETRNAVTDRGLEGGPHFVLSPQTPDGSPHTYGFQFCLFLDGIPPTLQAEADTGDYTVTIWALIENTISAIVGPPVWAAMVPQTGVGLNELWHSFDVNATAIRFQFGNLADDPATNNLSIGIALSEL